jgi:EmrB/QacA subfamily drug resistance transporter
MDRSAPATPDPTLSIGTDDGSKTPRRSWWVLTSTSLAVFAVFLDTTILFVAFPSISADFGSSASTMSWVLNAYTIAFAALLIPFGRLADRIGRRRTFLAAVIVFTTASMLCGLAPSVGVLIAARVLQAVGAAALVPASLALVLQTFPRDKIPFAVAIWGAIGAVAGAAGPTLGALVVEHFDWRWAFFINLPVGIISFTLGRKVLPEGRESNPGLLPDPLGVVLLATGLALAAYGIVESAHWGWASTQLTVTLAASAALIGWFLWRCSRVANPLLDLGLFHSNNFRWANAGTLVYATGFNAMFLGNVLFLTSVWQYSIIRAGLAISVGPLIVAATAPFLGRLAGRIGQRRLLVPGGLVWASGGVYLLARATVTPDYLGVYLPAVLMTGLGVSLCLPQLSSAAVQGLPADRFGSGSAVNQAIRNLGGTFGVSLVIAFTTNLTPATALDGFQKVWTLLVVSGIVVSLLSTRLRRSIPRTAIEGPATATVIMSPVAAH